MEICKLCNYSSGHCIFHIIYPSYNRNQVKYSEIIDYIKEKYNVTIYTQYISDVKRMHGIDLQGNKKDRKTKYGCSKDKITLVEDALRHFSILTDQASN